MREGEKKVDCSANANGNFGLQKVTCVKDIQKGVIAHNAVSTSTNLPLSFMFEQKGNSAVECFTCIFEKNVSLRRWDATKFKWC